MTRTLVQILATKELVAPLARDPIISVRSIWSISHLKCQKIFTGDDFFHSSEIIFLVPFWPPRRHWCHLQMILSCRGDQYGHLDIFNTKIYPLLGNYRWLQENVETSEE